MVVYESWLIVLTPLNLEKVRRTICNIELEGNETDVHRELFTSVKKPAKKLGTAGSKCSSLKRKIYINVV